MRFAVLTISDKGYAHQREDASGQEIIRLVQAAGYELAHYGILPDEQVHISAELRRLCDGRVAELVLTTGGTGFAKRDVTPEATLAVVERLCPGIPEAMRAYSMRITPRAMLTRSVCVIRKKSLILNLPGSPKAVSESLDAVLDTFPHALDMLRGSSGDCAR